MSRRRGSAAMDAEVAISEPSLLEHEAETSSSVRTNVLGCVALFGSLTIIIIFLLVFEKVPQHQGRVQSLPHLSRVLGELMQAANLSVNPCDNFFRHTCAGDLSHNRPLAAHVNSLLWGDGQGSAALPPFTVAGRHINAYYKTCLDWASGTHFVGKDTAGAIIEATQANATMPPAGVLRLLLQLSLQYGTSSMLDVHVESDSSNMTAVVHILSTRLTKGKNPNILHIRADALEAVNQAFGSRVTLEDLDSVYDDFFNYPSNISEHSTMDVLRDLAPGIGLDEWMVLLKELATDRDLHEVVSLPVSYMKSQFKIVLDQTRQPATIASIIVEAAVKMSSRFNLKVHLPPGIVKIICENSARRHLPLWIRGQLEHHETWQGIHMHSTFKIIVNTIFNETASVFDAASMENHRLQLNKLRLMLPSDIFLENVTLPSVKEGFISNELSFLHYSASLRRSLLDRHIDPNTIEAMEESVISISSNTMTVPVSIFTLMVFGNDSEHFITTPVIGVFIADALWNIVLSGNWTGKVNLSFDLVRTRSCLRNAATFDPRFRQLYLSLRSCVRASKGADWNHSLQVLSDVSMTRSRAFYMLYVYYHYCRRRRFSRYRYAKAANLFLAGFPDFLNSFQCQNSMETNASYICFDGASKEPLD